MKILNKYGIIIIEDKKDGDFMSKLNKIFLILIIIFLLVSVFSEVLADIEPDSFKPAELSESGTTITKFNQVIGAFQAIGSIASVVAIVVTGIRYMVASVEEKAEYKNTFIYYIVGAFLVFAISNVSALIYNWATGLNV